MHGPLGPLIRGGARLIGSGCPKQASCKRTHNAQSPCARRQATGSASMRGPTTPGSMPLLRGKPKGPAGDLGANSGSGGGARPAIPDFLMLPPDERQRARDQLVQALAPTQGMLSQITSDPVLSAGFEDPEVMAAVAEVAADPRAIDKHRTNAKVMRFYSSMGQLVGSRLEKVGGAADGAAGSGGDGRGGCRGAASAAEKARLEELGSSAAAAGGRPKMQQQSHPGQQRVEVRWRE